MRKLAGVVLAAALALVPAAARAEWKAAETAHFIIYSKSGDEALNELAERLESYHKLMVMATGVTEDVDPVKVRIYEVADTGEVEEALGLSDSGVAGFYDSNILGPYAVTPRKTRGAGRDFTPELVLHHEYAHHFMLQYFPAVYPGWYTEGFAELIGSSKPLDEGRIGYGMPAKHRGNEIAAYWVPLQDLLAKDRVRGLDAYGQGWALTHFFTLDSGRAQQLRQYLNALRAGKSRAEAAKVFGDLDKLNREARRYVTSGVFEYKPVKVEITRPVIRRSWALSPGEAALIEETIAFRDDELSLYRKESDRERERKLREATLQRIREDARRFPNDPYALHLLAEAEFAVGNHPQSEAAVDRLLALQPNHVRGLVRKSMNLSIAAQKLQGPARAAKAKEARALALRANKLDPDDPLPMLAFYQSFKMAGEAPTSGAMEGLIEVVRQLPRDTAARQLLVDELAAQKRWAAAISVLQPIANSAHRSPRTDAAREQMAKLRAELAKERGEPVPVEEDEDSKAKRS
jgi:tetratricopeptide (TPR) repeat protein